MTRTCLLILAAAALTACAPGRAMRDDDLQTLISECEARGGILAPLPGPPRSGNERANHTCEIRGGASRIQR
jgi:hypothetical protein